MTNKIRSMDRVLSRKQVNILGVRVDSTTEEEVLRVIGQKVAKEGQMYIVTPNPEIVLQAQDDRVLAEIIAKADFSLPDGSGLRLAEPGLNIIHGRKFMLRLFGMADREKLKVFFITSDERDTKDNLLIRLGKDYPGIKAWAAVGPRVGLDGRPVTEVDSKVNKDIVDEINNFKPDFLFVCFGQIKQEKWIYNNLGSLRAKLAIGVGGALDYYAGTKPFPPKWMEYLELEWLWRVFSEGNIVRVFKAVVVFPIKLFLSKF